MQIFNNNATVEIDFGTHAGVTNLIYVSDVTITDSYDNSVYTYNSVVKHMGADVYKSFFHLASAVADIYESKNTPSTSITLRVKDAALDSTVIRNFSVQGTLYQFDSYGNKIVVTQSASTNYSMNPSYRRIGQISDYSVNAGTFMSDLSKIYFWEGYPLDIYFRALNPTAFSISTDATATGSFAPTFSCVRVPLDRAGLLSETLGYHVSIPVVKVNECYKNPIYIRWANSIGGYSYYMLEGDSMSTKRKTTDLYSPFNPDISVSTNSGVIQRVIGRSGEFNCTLTLQDSDDHAGIEHLFYSNDVYMLIRGMWVKATVLNDYNKAIKATTIPVTLSIPQEYVA